MDRMGLRSLQDGCQKAVILQKSANHPDVPQYVSEGRDGGRHICSTPKRLGFVALTALTARKTERFLEAFRIVLLPLTCYCAAGAVTNGRLHRASWL